MRVSWFPRVLVAFDGSPAADAVLLAAALADSQTDLVALAVAGTASDAESPPLGCDPLMAAIRFDHVVQQIAPVGAQLRVVVAGDVGEAITCNARLHDFDLVVVPRTGDGRVWRRLIEAAGMDGRWTVVVVPSPSSLQAEPSETADCPSNELNGAPGAVGGRSLDGGPCR